MGIEEEYCQDIRWQYKTQAMPKLGGIYPVAHMFNQTTWSDRSLLANNK